MSAITTPTLWKETSLTPAKRARCNFRHQMLFGSDGTMNPQIQTVDFNERPFLAIWEVTQACDLRHF